MVRRPRERVAKRRVAKRPTRRDRHESPASPARPRRLHNLPTQLTTFIGREREIAQVRDLLSRTRLLTLTGSGGCGKTRLALQVARSVVEEHRDGVWLAELASITDPALVSKTVASTMNVPEQPGRDITDTLVDALRLKALLLILDNCEHLLAACRDLTATLLRTCPGVRILATSRESLSVPGETLWRVPSLSLPRDLRNLPSPGELILYDAVRLFADRAVATAPGFAVTSDNASAVVEVCQRLDGIPLAIELAAARVKVLAVEQIAARLDDRFRLLTGGSRVVLARQQTLRAAIDWSYNLLSETERVMLRRLSVFAGVWTLDASESVCAGEGVEGRAMLDLLTSLVDKSLVLAETQRGEARYRILETVRQYARDRLVDAGEAAEVHNRHRDWYLALAETANADLSRGRLGELWLARLESEHDNLRAALQSSETDRDGAEAGLRLAGALQWFWFRHGHWSEARGWLERALARSAYAPLPALSGALIGAADFAWRRGDYGLATALAEKGLALSRELGDQNGCWASLFHLGVIATRQEDFERAETMLDESLSLSRRLANDWAHGMTLVQIGIASWAQGTLDLATTHNDRGLDLLRAVGDEWSIAWALYSRGFTALYREDYDRAVASFVEGLSICHKIADRWVSEECLEGLARIATARRRYERAARLFGTAEVLREELGYRFGTRHQARHDQDVAHTRAALGDTAFLVALAEGQAMTLEQAIEYALSPGVAATGRTAAPGHLTAREQEVAALVARGLTNREIASALVVTERTAETHVQNILNKLGFSSRAQIAAWAVERGLKKPKTDPP